MRLIAVAIFSILAVSTTRRKRDALCLFLWMELICRL
jgi:hypothetical protein